MYKYLIELYEEEKNRVQREISDLWKVGKKSPKKADRLVEIDYILDGLNANQTIRRLEMENSALKTRLAQEGIYVELRKIRVMEKEEIKDYLKRVDELGTKLIGEDKETYAWLIYGYNQCAKLLNETEQQCKKQKEVIDKALLELVNIDGDLSNSQLSDRICNLIDILKEVSE